ncbi:S-layer homology domain-containing protein [Syntrophomonas erecta]
MQRKITSLLLTVAMLLSLFALLPERAFAADGTTWDGNAYPITEGEGTKADPYIIDTAGKLAYLAERVNAGDADYQNAYYRLTEDLDLSGHDWEPIGYSPLYTVTFQGYQGYFDGNGHKITGMNVDITSEANAGLFGIIESATIKNLSVSGDVKVGKIDNLGDSRGGGIVGIALNSKIINCYHSGSVAVISEKNTGFPRLAGGIAGVINNSELINCYHSGPVSASIGDLIGKLTSYVGGVVGLTEGTNTIEYCYWDSEDTITPDNDYGIGNATSAVPDVEAFTDLDDLLANLNANLDELEDDTLYKWKAVSDGYPTFDSAKWTASADASIDPSEADFDKYTGADISVTKSDGNHTLIGINNGGAPLTENADYTINDNTVTIKKEYLANLTTGFANLTFDYSGGIDPVLTITITDSTSVASSDASLSALTINSGTLSPAFASDKTSYTASVAHSITSVNVTPTVNQTDAVVKVNGVTTISATPSTVGLNVGANTITILVTAQDKSTTETYTLTLTRAGAGSSSSGGGGGSSPTYYSASVDTKSNNGEINFDKTRSTAGSKVTIAVTPDEGYQIDRLIILDKDGQEVSYTSNDDGTYSFTMPSGHVTVNALFTEIPTILPEEPQALPFVDVEENGWYYHSVDYVYQNQLFAGTSEEKFEPATPMSRAMLVTVLWRLEGLNDESVDQVFSDVLPGAYYSKAVSWANSQEIVQGYGDGTFGPLDNITREQMALIFYKYAQFKGYDTSAATELDSFHDGSKVSPWALDTVKWAVAGQILSGKGDGILDPSGNASRAEAASILMRLVTNQAG